MIEPEVTTKKSFLFIISFDSRQILTKLEKINFLLLPKSYCGLFNDPEMFRVLNHQFALLVILCTNVCCWLISRVFIRTISQLISQLHFRLSTMVFLRSLSTPRPILIIITDRQEHWRLDTFLRVPELCLVLVVSWKKCFWCCSKVEIFFVTDIEAECRDDVMKLRVAFNDTFSGLIYSAGKKSWQRRDNRGCNCWLWW